MKDFLKKDVTKDFYEEYVQKYITEITDENSLIKVNDEDSSIFLGIMENVNRRLTVDDGPNDTYYEALDLYNLKNGLANFLAFKVIKIIDGKFYIDPVKLEKKVMDHKKFEQLDDEKDFEVVSVYKKGPKK